MRNHNVHGKCRHGRWFGPAWVWFPAWIGLRLCNCCGCSRLSRSCLPFLACVHRHVARLTPRRPCCSLRQVSTAQLPLDPARLRGGRRHASLQLSSPQLSSSASALAQLTSAQLSSLRMGPSAGRPHSVSPLAWNLQPNLPRCHQLVRSASASGPRAAQPATGRMGRAERCSQPVRLSPLAPRSGPKLNSSTCEPPVIDL